MVQTSVFFQKLFKFFQGLLRKEKSEETIKEEVTHLAECELVSPKIEEAEPVPVEPEKIEPPAPIVSSPSASTPSVVQGRPPDPENLRSVADFVVWAFATYGIPRGSAVGTRPMGTRKESIMSVADAVVWAWTQ